MTAPKFQVIQPTGVLTGTTAHELSQQFDRCLNENVKIILIDLQATDFIDSSGLGVLVSLHTKLRLAEGSICALPKNKR